MKMSESIASLAKALSLFQGEIKDVVKDKQGHNCKYGDLSQVLEIARPLLSKYELCITQDPGMEEDKVTLETTLMHSSGEWKSSIMKVPFEKGKMFTNAQAVGAITTYMRRYASCSALGIAQADDDGAMVSNGNNIGHTSQEYSKAEGYSRNPPPLQVCATPAIPVSEDEKVKQSTYAKLCSDMMSYGTSDETIEKWKAHFGVTMLDQLSQKQALSIIKKLNSLADIGTGNFNVGGEV